MNKGRSGSGVRYERTDKELLARIRMERLRRGMDKDDDVRVEEPQEDVEDDGFVTVHGDPFLEKRRTKIGNRS